MNYAQIENKIDSIKHHFPIKIGEDVEIGGEKKQLVIWLNGNEITSYNPVHRIDLNEDSITIHGMHKYNYKFNEFDDLTVDVELKEYID